VSSHIFPEFSVHLLAATASRHWMESLDLASPILKEPLRFAEGQAVPPARPGAGLEWDEDAVRRYLVE
jgi:mandelate racemase